MTMFRVPVWSWLAPASLATFLYFQILSAVREVTMQFVVNMLPKNILAAMFNLVENGPSVDREKLYATTNPLAIG
jgi:hypothetical protein